MRIETKEDGNSIFDEIALVDLNNRADSFNSK